MRFLSNDFPNLHSGNYRDTSPADRVYNCIAWAAGVNDLWWEPVQNATSKQFWPASAPRDDKLTSLILAYESVGFVICADDTTEGGIEKIALYADGGAYTHAAPRQLETGKWTTKIGVDEDIEHDTLEDVAGPAYGHVATFMKRSRP